MSLEKNFYQLLRRHLEPRLSLQRIETPVGSGVPDVNYCGRGAEGWLELKAWENRQRRGTFIVPALRPAQVAWLHRRRHLGGRAFFLFKVSDDVFLFDGLMGKFLLERQITWVNLGEFTTLWLQRPYDWERLITKLTENE